MVLLLCSIRWLPPAEDHLTEVLFLLLRGHNTFVSSKRPTRLMCFQVRASDHSSGRDERIQPGYEIARLHLSSCMAHNTIIVFTNTLCGCGSVLTLISDCRQVVPCWNSEPRSFAQSRLDASRLKRRDQNLNNAWKPLVQASHRIASHRMEGLQDCGTAPLKF